MSNENSPISCSLSLTNGAKLENGVVCKQKDLLLSHVSKRGHRGISACSWNAIGHKWVSWIIMVWFFFGFSYKS